MTSGNESVTQATIKPVGTVVGVSSTAEFQMQVRPDAVRAQDLVAVDTWEIVDGDETKKQRFRVWAKVGSIERLNPLFPKEAAQELAFQGRDPVDSVVSMSREMITATCRVIGVQRDGRLEPPKYPVQPAGQVYVPNAADIEAFLVGETPEHQRLLLGHERGNADVRVYVDGNKVVSRHVAVLASTGAGKTVATRKLLEELMVKHYPILIFDPHGDYAGLHIARKTEVTTYLPQIRLGEEDVDQVVAYVSGLSREVMTAPQQSFMAGMAAALSDTKRAGRVSELIMEMGQPRLAKSLERDHFFAFAELADRIRDFKAENDRAQLPKELMDIAGGLNVQSGTASAVGRQCAKAGKQFASMVKSNKKYSGASAPLPSTRDLAGIIKKGAVAIVSLEGYSDELRQSIVAGVLQRLLADRIDDKVPGFLTVIEEAHNFIPGSTAGGFGGIEAPSLPIIKQIATEGRKYAMGLVFISQRPSRIDATVLSQANSFLILRIVNPNDQKYIRDVVESMGEDEARTLPNLNTGEALLSGSFTRIPVMVKVEQGFSSGKHEDEDFIGKFA